MTTTRYNVRSAHGTVHSMTAGEYGKVMISNADGSDYRSCNRPGTGAGRADCGTLTSTAARPTEEPVNCPKCAAKK